MPRYDLTFRVFVSSTFGDFIEERNALQDKVFPRVREYCRQQGARFQAIDLRWGVPRDVANDQQTLDLCLRELRACQQRSPGANLIVLVGQRYGWRPLPSRIEASELDRLIAIASPSQARRLRRWYRRDDNAVPAEYFLKPRGTFVKRDRWARLEESMRKMLAEGARAVFAADDSRCLKYHDSATHAEIRQGIIESSEGANALCYLRTIRDLPEDQTAAIYRDMVLDTSGEWIVDTEAKSGIDSLRTEMASLSPDCLRTYEGDWKNGAPVLDLKAFSERVEADLKNRIDAERQAFQTESAIVRERRVQLDFAVDRGANLCGREGVLESISQYLRSESRLPLIVSGPSGAGKTAVLAKIWLDLGGANSDVLCLARIIGATPGSSELRALLRSLCMELAEPAQARNELPDDFLELVAEFEKRIRSAANVTDLILILDGIDQLAPTDDAHSLHWLPQGDLPVRMKLLLSLRTGADVEHACLLNARRRFPTEFLELPELVAQDGEEMLAIWLGAGGRGQDDAPAAHRSSTAVVKRVLQPEQKGLLLRGFASCPIPLYLKLAFEEAWRWRSYDVIGSIAPDIRGLLNELFRRLERPEFHGSLLPGRALGYLEAARRGLSEDELIEILSADTQVMEDFRQRSPDSPNVGTLPVVMWLRLASELAPYLVSLSFEGVEVLSFQHLQIADAVKEQYLAGTARQLHHVALSQHFLDQGFRHLDTDVASVNGRIAAVDKRQVDELPWQLTRAVEAGSASALVRLEQVLTDLRFIEAKCLGGRLYDLVADYGRALTVLRKRHGVEIDERTTNLNQYAVDLVDYARRLRTGEAVAPPALTTHHDNATPDETQTIAARFRLVLNFVSSASHLLGKYPHETIPIALTAADPVLAEQAEDLCQVRKAVWIVRTLGPRSEPGALVRTLGGGSTTVAMNAPGHVAVTAGAKGAASVWDLTTGEPVRYLSGHFDDITCVAMTPDGQLAVTGGGTFRHVTRAGIVDGAIIATPVMDVNGRPMSTPPDYALRVWDLSSGAQLGALRGHSDRVYGVAVSADGETVVSASADGTIRLWSGTDFTCLEVNRICLRDVRSLSLDAAGELCLVVCGEGKTHLWRPRAFDWQTLRHPDGAKYLGADLSADAGLVVAATEHALHGWPTESPLSVKTVVTDATLVGPIRLSADGRCVVAASKNDGLIIWRQSDESSVGIVQTRPDGCTSLAISPDGRFALAASPEGTHWLDLSRASTLSPKPASAPRLEIFDSARNGTQLLNRSLEGGGNELLIVRPPIDTASTVETLELTAPDASGGRFCADGEALAMRRSGNVSVWSTRSGKCLGALPDTGTGLETYATASDEPVIMTVGEDHQIRVWNALDRTLLHDLGSHLEDVACVEVSDDGCVGVSGGGKYRRTGEPPGDYALRVWDLERGRPLHSLIGHTTPISHIVLDRCGKAAISSSHEDMSGRLRFWDIEWGLLLRDEVVAPMSLSGGPILKVRNMSFAPDGATVAVGSFNNEMTGIRLFHALTGRNEQFAESDGKFWRLDFVRSGRVVVGYSWSGLHLSVWDFVTGDLLADYPASREISPLHFKWVDVPPERSVYPVAGELCTFEIRNLPPNVLPVESVIAALASDHERRRLAALWYVIEHPSPPDLDSRRAAVYVGSILDQVCLPVDELSHESVRHAAIKAAIATGPIVLGDALARLQIASQWRVVGALALVVGSMAAEPFDDDVRAALTRAASHSDERTRKQLALMLDRHQGDWSRRLSEELRHDNSVDSFMKHVRAGTAVAAELLYPLISINDLLENRLCPTADQELDDFASVLQNMIAQNKEGLPTWPGGTHPYFEYVRFQQLGDQARAAGDHRASAYHNQAKYLHVAHDLDGIESGDAQLLSAIEHLASVSLPVKRLLAAKIARTDDKERAQTLLEIRRSVDLIQAGWESISDEAIRNTWETLANIEDPAELVAALGANAALDEVQAGIGAREWYAYLKPLVGRIPEVIYCLANTCAQTIPGRHDQSAIVSIFEASGLKWQAKVLQRKFAALDLAGGSAGKPKTTSGQGAARPLLGTGASVGFGSTPHPSADPNRAAALNIAYQQALARWKALPWWQRKITPPPEPPTGI